MSACQSSRWFRYLRFIWARGAAGRNNDGNKDAQPWPRSSRFRGIWSQGIRKRWFLSHCTRHLCNHLFPWQHTIHRRHLAVRPLNTPPWQNRAPHSTRRSRRILKPWTFFLNIYQDVVHSKLTVLEFSASNAAANFLLRLKEEFHTNQSQYLAS